MVDDAVKQWTSVHPTSSWLHWDVHEAPICRLQLSVKHHLPWNPPREAHPVRSACIYLSVTSGPSTSSWLEGGSNCAIKQLSITVPGTSALVPPMGVSSLHCSYSSTPMTATPGNPQWNSWGMQTTVIELIRTWQVRIEMHTASPLVKSEPSGASPSQNCTDDSGLQEKSTAAQHCRQHSVYCEHLEVSGIHSFSGPEGELPHRHCLQESSAEVIAKEV